MKITNISCTQFAGVRDRNVSFTDGINVVYGKNESGKSTLVNLISRTLFQNAKLDRRSDKKFFELYFPGARKGSRIAGDFADGRISFETENGKYTLSKEWGADARCTLSTPEGVIRDPNMISEILKEALLYGEGVYSEMLFSSQRNTDASLQTILDAAKSETKQEITDAVSQAFAESDGISIDAIEQAIQEKIDELAGKYWDIDRQAPVPSTKRRTNSVGKVLKAYYDLEDARMALNQISRLEQEADSAANAYAVRDAATRTAEEAYNRFHTFAGRLAVQSGLKKAIQRLNADREKFAGVLSKWPQLNEKLEKAKKLQAEKENRVVLDLWNFVKEAQAELSDEDQVAAQLPYPDHTEVATVKKHQREITASENKLCGMNLKAAIRMLGGNEVQIVSLRTGEEVDTAGGLASITEAVKITVPGVMEMQLSPADVDVASVEENIARLKETVAVIFAKYQVKTLEELEAYARKIDAAKAKKDRVQTKIARALGTVSLAQLEEQYTQACPVSRSKEEIESDILTLCGGTDVARFIAKAETVIEGYASEYSSVNDLKARAFDLEVELKKNQDAVSGAGDIPAEYQSITDPEAYLDALQRDLKQKQNARETALQLKASTARALEDYKTATPEACQETVDKAERCFEEAKSLLNHWRHIDKVFRAQKGSLHDNPMQDIADRFAHYLSVISGGKVSSEFPEADKLNMSIYSDNILLDYQKLSEGTKETVSLAFRLAVLDHLFPQGGGVIVFDDPFTDMDADRTAKSCSLLRECATRHQVIFLTCKEEYLNELEGNKILF